LLFYVALPSLEMLSNPPEKTLGVRSVQTIEIPPPPPERPKPKPNQPQPKAPKPQLQQMQKSLVPLQAAMNLNVALGDVGGDFAVGFGVSGDDLTQQLEGLIFELSELDEKPRPLAQLKPIYPQQARMRKIEGFVIIDFVVSEDGTARSIEVVSEQPTSVFTEEAINAIMRWRFAPGTKGGKKVPARVRQKVQFTLD